MKKTFCLLLLLLISCAPVFASTGSYRVDGKRLVLTSDWELSEQLNTKGAVPQGLTGPTIPGFSEIDTIDLNGNDIVIAATVSGSNPVGQKDPNQINNRPGVVLQQSMTLTNGSQDESTLSVESGGFGTGSTSGAVVVAGKVSVTISNLTLDASGATGRRPGDGPVQACAMGLEVAEESAVSVKNCNVYGAPAAAVIGTYSQSGQTLSGQSASLNASGSSFDYRLNSTSAFAATGGFDAALVSLSLDSGTPSVVLSNTSVTGNSDLGTCGVCLGAPGSNFRIGGTSSIEGRSGIVLRGGSLTVSDKAQITGTGKGAGSGGAGIYLEPMATTELLIGGSPTIVSQSTSALSQVSGTHESLLKRLQITGGYFVAGGDAPALSVAASSAQASVLGGAFSSRVDLNYLNEAVAYASKTDSGYIYGPDVSSLTTTALSYGLTIIDTLPVGTGNEYGLPGVPDSSNKIITLAFDPGELYFYGPATDDGASVQALPLNLKTEQFGSDAFLAWDLNWEIRSVNVPTNVNQAKLADPLDWKSTLTGTSQSYPDLSTYDFATRFSQTGWALAQNTTTNAQGQTTVKQTYLINNGTYTSPGTYELTVSVPGQYTSDGNEHSASIVFTVQTTSVKSVQITDYGTKNPAQSTVSYNMNTTPSVQYSYLATNFNGAETPGANGQWNLTMTEGNVSDYAQFDPESGKITFKKPTGSGQYLILTVAVEGAVSEPVYISVKSITLTLSTDQIRFTSAEQSGKITASFTSPDYTAPLTWKIEPETVASVEAVGNEATVTAVSDGVATLTVSSGVLSASATVTVSSVPVNGDISITASDPDSFTVSLSNLTSQAGFDLQNAQVSVFAWSQDDQSDINAKVASKTEDDRFVQAFPVNDTPEHEHFMRADTIHVSIYASSGSSSYLLANRTVSWVDPQAMGSHSCAYIGYSQNIGFDLPTVFDGQMSGTEGQALGLEGLRISSGIEGVQVISDVHVENVGWVNDIPDGVYAGTMGQNLQIEAVNLRLEGPNAQNYQISYKVHGQNYGWTDWVTGEVAGTTGQNLQLEALQVQITKIN